MVCASCSHHNQQGAYFCRSCGVSLSSGGQAVNMPPQQPQFGGNGWQSLPTTSSLPSASTPPVIQLQGPGQGGIEGIGSQIRLISEQSGWGYGMQGWYQHSVQVLSFRLEQFDALGNRTQTVPVEMRGRSLPGAGSIRDGDELVVFGQWMNKLFQAEVIQDNKTKAIIKAKGNPAAMTVSIIIAAVVSIALMTFAGYKIVSMEVFHQIPIPPSLNASPDNVLSDYCNNILPGDYQHAYNHYSVQLQSQVSAAQLEQMWASKKLDRCVFDSLQVSGNQATARISTHEFFTGNIQSYSITLIQESNGDWKIDSLQPQ